MKQIIIRDEGICSIDNFWDSHTCKTIINDLNSVNLFPVKNLTTDNSSQNLEENLVSRNEHRIIYESLELANEIWEKLFEIKEFRRILPHAVSINSCFRFYKYYVSQEFLPHVDGAIKLSENKKSLHSLLIYLNHNYKGGITKFENYEIFPSTGKLVFFQHNMLHSSSRIERGCKYILRTDIISEFPL